jgi:biopolymer transport protein ExbD
MALALLSRDREPLGEINTTPLIDVMLVLLIMIIVTVPLSTHSLEVDLPSGVVVGEPHPVRNLLGIDRNGELVWNGRSVSETQLAGLLTRVRAMNPEPQVQFRPDADASYERSAQVLRMVKASRITNFGFVDNEKYRSFARMP